MRRNTRKSRSKLLSICFSSSTSTTVTTLTSFELPSSHARVTTIKFTKQQLVSESVSELVTRVNNDGLGSDKNNHKMAL